MTAPLATDLVTQTPEGDACPNCGAASLERDVVDIGVGNLYGPWRCLNCAWQEPAPDPIILDEETQWW